MKRIVGVSDSPYQPPNMLNDLSSPLSLLQTRRSGKPRELVGPGPTEDELEQILSIGARTPDHGKLHPWRFISIADNQRDDLAVVFRQALASEDECAPPLKHEKADEFAHHAGKLVVLISAPVHDHKIPLWEQELSCGAAAMNLLLAAHALGYVAGWVTGWYAYSEHVRRAFCGPGEKIAGYIFIGHPGRELEERERAPLATISARWHPPTF